MAGFSLNLKGKVQKPSKLGNRPLKRANADSKSGLKNVLGGNEEKEDSVKTSIDSFSKKGAMAGGSALDEQRPLVIKPKKLSTGLLRKEEAAGEPKQTSVEDEARQSIMKGESFENDSGLVIRGGDDQSLDQSENDYEQVPVSQFGAALLRGMGWDGKDNSKEDESLSRRQRGAVLGIGSKPLKEDLEKDIMGDRNTKLLAPLKKRET